MLTKRIFLCKKKLSRCSKTKTVRFFTEFNNNNIFNLYMLYKCTKCKIVRFLSYSTNFVLKVKKSKPVYKLLKFE